MSDNPTSFFSFRDQMEKNNIQIDNVESWRRTASLRLIAIGWAGEKI